MKSINKRLSWISFCWLILATAFVACSGPKEETVERLRVLYEDAKAHSKEYSDEQWQAYLVEWQQVDSLLSLYEFSEEELAEISPMKGRCGAYAMKAASVDASKQITNALQESRGVFKGFVNGLD